MFCQSGGVAQLHCLCSRSHDLLIGIQQFQYAGAGNCFDTADTRGNGTLGQNAEQTQLCGIIHMRTAAEFYRIIAYGNNTNDIAVLFAEQSHCSQLSGFSNGQFLCHDRNCFQNLFIDQSLCLLDLLMCHCCKVREVKTAAAVGYQLTSLMYMVAQNAPQSSL